LTGGYIDTAATFYAKVSRAGGAFQLTDKVYWDGMGPNLYGQSAGAAGRVACESIDVLLVHHDGKTPGVRH